MKLEWRWPISNTVHINQDADHLYLAPSCSTCSMVVALHDHIISLATICKMYLCLIIGDLTGDSQPHIGTVKSHDKTPWLNLSIGMFYLAIHVK